MSIFTCLEYCQQIVKTICIVKLADVTNEVQYLIIMSNSPEENYVKCAKSSNENFNSDIEQDHETFADCCVFA